MHLKSIQMQGFKSFADKIYLDFNSGITAIVGPNGSGKSNISDAIRWVMGEQSIKSLRGSKMEDIIFSGTEKRKALGFAEVTLTLDNTDGYFKLDFPEVSVTRRIYRSGEGEYYINKTLCRLKDIHELLMDTGLGRDGYSIIGQGKIDSILSTKSEDRRQIFEEAAGISKYKYRKIEAERKLVQTVDNLTRVKDILSELESQIGPLERQAEKAKKYLVLRDEMRGLDISVSIVNIERIKAEVAKLNSDISTLNSQIDDITAELNETDLQISNMYDEMREIDGEIEDISERERVIALELNEDEKNAGILRNDIEHNIKNIERLNIETESIMESIKVSEEELEAHKTRLAELNRESDTNKSEIDAMNLMAERSGEMAAEKNAVLENLRKSLAEVTTELGAIKGAIDNIEILRQSFESRKNDITGQKENRKKENEQLKTSYEKACESEKELRDHIADFEVSRRELENKLKSEKDASDKLIKDKNETSLEVSKKRSRKTMLEDMERDLEGYAKGVKCVMSAFNDGKFKNKGIYGPLVQLIKTDKKYIAAIETALGAAGQNIVTETEKEAKEAIAYLKENKLGRATFLPVSAIRGRKFEKAGASACRGYIATADELVECDSKYSEIVSSFLSSTVICDNIDNAVSMAKVTRYKFKIVSLGGDVIQPGGAMTGGSAVKTTGSLSRAGEIEKLNGEIRKLEAEYEKQTKCEEDIRKRTSALNTEYSEINQKIDVLKSELAKAQADKKSCEALIENSEATGNHLDAEIIQITEKLSSLVNESSEKTELLTAKQGIRDELENDMVRVEGEYRKLFGENERNLSGLTELNIKRSAILKDIELENERIGSLNNASRELLESVKIKRGGAETLKERNAEIEKQINDIMQKDENLRESVKNFGERSESLNNKRREIEQCIRERQGSVKGTQEQKFKLTQQVDKAESRVEKLNSDREGIINRIWDDYELTFSEAVELKENDDFDYNASNERIRELKTQIKNLGNINIDAIEEYKNVKERFDFLSVQTDDLEKSKAELDALIKEMMEIMQTRFAEQFKIINANFSRVFAELFGGGRANLSLTDPDNVLESGIEIEAQPPGKKLQSLLLLSGGERAFTAIALLFAILDVRPTPFCILDEIEAALDDVNVYRYADYLKKYRQKTQFIVVTHRRGTMEAANILYGVTMQERGISKLLSLNIDEVKDVK